MTLVQAANARAVTAQSVGRGESMTALVVEQVRPGVASGRSPDRTGTHRARDLRWLEA